MDIKVECLEVDFFIIFWGENLQFDSDFGQINVFDVT